MMNQADEIGPVQAIKQRLGSRTFWSLQLAWMTLFVSVFSSLALDSIRLANFSPIWLLIAALTYIETVILGLLVKHLAPQRIWNRKLSYLYTAIAASVIGGIKNTSVALLAQFFELESGVNLAVRFLGGMGLGLAIALGAAIFFGSHLDHQETMRRLKNSHEQLQSYRLGSKELMQREVEAMIAETNQIISPRIQEIETLLEGDEPLENSVAQIRKLLTESVKPFSGRLLSRADNLTKVDAPVSQKSRLSRYRELSNFQLANYLHPKNLWMIFTLWHLAMVMVTLGPEYLPETLISLLALVPALYLFRAIARRLKTKKLANNLAITFVFCAIASPLTIFSIWADAVEKNLILLVLGYSFVEILVTVLGGLFLNVLNEDRNRLEAQARDINANLERRVKQLEQGLWLSRKRWGYMLHGKVQSLLTIAINRLNSNDLEIEELRKQTLIDFEKIRESISKPAPANIDLNAEIKQLVEAWRGVCDVRVKIERQAANLLATDSDAQMCVNEVAKEVVSNAFRHGRARTVSIQVEKVSENEIAFTAINDGFSLGTNSAGVEVRRGIGSQMLDEITLEWALKSDRVAQKTVFRARIAVDSNRAN